MPTFLYSPGVKVYIHSTRKNSVIDVSADLVNGTVAMAENAIGAFQLALANHRRKYDGVFSPNDRISIQMKRIKWMQVFAGYLNEVPYYSIYPRTIPLSGACTLKRLQYTLWDPGSDAAYRLLSPGQGVPSVAEMKEDTDGGMRSRLEALLTKVGNWPDQNIHIGRIPDNWLGNIKRLFETVEERLKPFTPAEATSVGTGASVAGGSTLGGGTMSVQPDPDVPQATGTIPDNGTGKASWFGGPGGGAYGNMLLTSEPGGGVIGTPSGPSDQWYCAMRWPFKAIASDGDARRFLSAEDERKAVAWWKNRRILVVNPLNMKAVVLRAADWGPNGDLNRIIDMSQHALETVLGATTDTTLQVRFAPMGAEPGPFTIPPPTTISGGLLGMGLDMLNQPAAQGSAQDFVTLAAAQAGDTYRYGAEANLQDPDPKAFDCSELVEWACARVGVKFPDGTDAQLAAIKAAGLTKTVQEAALIRGALLFHPGHVAISLGDGSNTIEAMGTQYGVLQGNIGNRFNEAGLIPGINYSAVGTGASGGAGVSQLGAAAPTYTSGSGPLNTAYYGPGGTSNLSSQLTGYRALANDEPLMNIIQQFAKVAMRSFMAAPNGDFIAWFPDYYGHYGTAGRLKVEPIELLGDGFTVSWADQYLITHQFVVGAEVDASGASGIEGQADENRILYTKGIASVEFPELLASLFNIEPGTNDPRSDLFLEAESLLRRYGARVDRVVSGNIPAGIAEFWYACYLFMRSWAQQFSSQVDLTFMPELYPGMIIEIPKYKVQMYCAGVTHSFDFRGMGFTTHATVTSLSATDSSGLFAIPIGVGAK